MGVKRTPPVAGAGGVGVVGAGVDGVNVTRGGAVVGASGVKPTDTLLDLLSVHRVDVAVQLVALLVPARKVNGALHRARRKPARRSGFRRHDPG